MVHKRLVLNLWVGPSSKSFKVIVRIFKVGRMGFDFFLSFCSLRNRLNEKAKQHEGAICFGQCFSLNLSKDELT